MNTTSTIAGPQQTNVEPASAGEWQDDYKAHDKKTTFREDWESLLSAINPRFARHGRAASIIWPLSVLTLVMAAIYGFSDRVDWHNLPLKTAVLGATIAVASQFWPHRVVRYFNLDGRYPRPGSTIDRKEKRLRILYKLWIALLVVAWIGIVVISATTPATPDEPAEGRIAVVAGMSLFLASMAALPFFFRLKNRQERAKKEKAAKKNESLPATYAEAQAITEAGAADMPWLLKFVQFRYRIYTTFVPDDDASRRYRVRTWGRRNAHRRFVGPIARAYDWLMAWILLGTGWLVFGSLAWAISQGWSKAQGFAKGHIWHWFTSLL